MKSQRRKALLSIAFASCIICSPIPAFSEEKGESAESVEQKILRNTQLTPELRALFLLNIARDYLNGSSKVQVERRHSSSATTRNSWWSSSTWELIFTTWNQRHPSTPSTHHGQHNLKTALPNSRVDSENIGLAQYSITLALEQLGNTTEPFQRLGLRFIALQLLRELGNSIEYDKCKKTFEAELKVFEEDQSTNEEHIRNAISILNALANSVIPVRILDYEPEGYKQTNVPSDVSPFTESEFRESEKFRLRGLRLADRLGAEKHVRRKAHRDMVIWYSKLGKVALAEKEKKVLFDLVGFEDDSILNPVPGGCGHVVWWRTTSVGTGIMCGMG